MARRRLMPGVTGQGGTPAPAARSGPQAPIATTVADAAGTAALEEMAGALQSARDSGRMILDLPLDRISADHLSRDRIPVEDEEMAALRESLRLHGQRTPIEVTPLEGTALPYGLISGWRRLHALKTLAAETGESRFATVQAIIRKPDTVADAYVNMVEENEVRVGLSQYERARVAALATQRGIFPTEKAALLALFASASRAKRSRIRAFLELYHALDGVLRFPTHLPERLGLQLVDAVRAGEAGRIAEKIAAADPGSPEEELEALRQALAPGTAPAKPRPKKTAAETVEIEPGIALEQSLSGKTLTLKLRGRGVTPELRDRVMRALKNLD